MKARIIVVFLILINISLAVGEHSFYLENTENSLNNYKPEYGRPKIATHRESKRGLADVWPAKKMDQMLQSKAELLSKSIIYGDINPIDEGNQKILKFGKRVIESIKTHGIIDKESHLQKFGKHRINWWMQNRRLEKIRKRLSEELVKKPELKHRLQSLGWRNGSEPISHQKKKIHSDNEKVQKPSHFNNESKNTLLYKTLVTRLEALRIEAAGKETTKPKQPTILVYMPITIAARPSEVDRSTEDASSNGVPDIDSPTKFVLNTLEEEDFDATVSDIDVINPLGRETSTFRAAESPPSRWNSQRFDSDRLLLLIPLIVEELRSGIMSEEERRAFSGIFGKRLWQLFEREASKLPSETMDRDLAMFLFTGKLVLRDPENGRRKRRQRRYVPTQRIVAKDLKKEDDYDYDFEDRDEYDRSESANDHRTSKNSEDDEEDNNASFVELIELAARHKTRKLEEERKEREEEEKQRKNWSSDEYDDYNYDYNNY